MINLKKKDGDPKKKEESPKSDGKKPTTKIIEDDNDLFHDKFDDELEESLWYDELDDDKLDMDD